MSEVQKSDCEESISIPEIKPFEMRARNFKNRDQHQDEKNGNEGKQDGRDFPIRATGTYRAEDGNAEKKSSIDKEYRRRSTAVTHGRDDNESDDAHRYCQL